MQLGPFLKEIRLGKNYTIAEVGKKTSLSIGLLSQIENGKITPSLQTLELLLKFYSVNFSDFFKQVEQKKFVYVRQSEVEILDNREHGFKLMLLASKLQNNALESFIVELSPGSKLNVACLNREINAERIIYGLDGVCEIFIEKDQSFTIGKGDSINFKSYVECEIKNSSGTMAKFLISGMPPIFI